MVMVDSGNQISDRSVSSDYYNTYKAMVDAALARPPKATIQAQSQRVGNKLRFDIQLTNLSGVTLSSGNSATVNAIVYEDAHVGVTDRYVRAVVSTGISPDLANGATGTFTLETAELSGVDWDKIHSVVLADYRPGGSLGAYDMLQAASATPSEPEQTALMVSKQDNPDPVQAGVTLTYTIRVVNNGDVELHATVTDTLPAHVTYAGPLVWTPTIAASDVWTRTLIVTVEAGYTGTLINRVQVTTDEGETGECVAITNGSKTYLPLIIKNR